MTTSEIKKMKKAENEMLCFIQYSDFPQYGRFNHRYTCATMVMNKHVTMRNIGICGATKRMQLCLCILDSVTKIKSAMRTYR